MSDWPKYDLTDIVVRLVGPIRPIGETNADAERIANLKTLTELIDQLVSIVITVRPFVDRPEASMKAIGEHAREFLTDLAEALETRKP
jgi:hypothetical protein